MDRQIQSIPTARVTNGAPPVLEAKSAPMPDSIGDGAKGWDFFGIGRPKLRLTSEYDSDSSIFLHKASCKLLDDFAKVKVSFKNDKKGEVMDPQISFTTKFFSMLYDVEENDALLKASFDVLPGLQFKAFHQVKAQQGELAVSTNLAGPAYKLELLTGVPFVGMPRATFKFPLGEISLTEKDEETEEKKFFSANGILKSHILGGLCTAQYSEECLDLRYAFKDEQLTFIPKISLPSNALSFALKRSFSPSDKWSYWYHFDSDNWSTVYKRTIRKDYKFKAGYDSEVKLGWASLWVGDEAGKAKSVPMKLKMQFMLQVPKDDIKSSVFLFRVKKRWDV